jgi:hypothetical protein
MSGVLISEEPGNWIGEPISVMGAEPSHPSVFIMGSFFGLFERYVIRGSGRRDSCPHLTAIKDLVIPSTRSWRIVEFGK